jgi:hypothetical protein
VRTYEKRPAALVPTEAWLARQRDLLGRDLVGAPQLEANLSTLQAEESEHG